MKMETLRQLRYIAKQGDHWVSFDLKYGLYALAIHPKNREAFTMNLNGHLLQLCALTMGWSLTAIPYRSSTRTEFHEEANSRSLIGPYVRASMVTVRKNVELHPWREKARRWSS